MINVGNDAKISDVFDANLQGPFRWDAQRDEAVCTKLVSPVSHLLHILALPIYLSYLIAFIVTCGYCRLGCTGSA